MRRTDSTNLLGRLDPGRPSYTITTQFNNVTAGCFHPTEDRALSIREGARLQSFPDSFVFTGTASSRCRRLGTPCPHSWPSISRVPSRDHCPRNPSLSRHGKLSRCWHHLLRSRQRTVDREWLLKDGVRQSPRSDSSPSYGSRESLFAVMSGLSMACAVRLTVASERTRSRSSSTAASGMDARTFT